MGPINPRRNKAFLIDLLIYMALIITSFLFVDILPERLGGKTFILGLTLGLLYIVLRDGFNGQSVGKRVFKVQLIHKMDRKPIGIGMAILRGILTSLPILSWIDFCLTVFTPDSQRYTDKLLGIELVHVLK